MEKDSIDLEVLKAVAMCWSIVFEEKPAVHPSRLHNVSKHLKD